MFSGRRLEATKYTPGTSKVSIQRRASVETSMAGSGFSLSSSRLPPVRTSLQAAGSLMVSVPVSPVRRISPPFSTRIFPPSDPTAP
ncbi:hypothetical protein [Rubrobacter xylanophilus]|uniref:hypothetical protein n=1 Tax=Rubrobacter xylanophilus TaxID=49319 RepID=UPI001C643333|nr:hypothetical protein [Rubrobacter xylanophilus]